MNKIVICRQRNMEILELSREEAFYMFRRLEKEIDEGVVAGRNHAVTVMRYDPYGELLEAYCRLGAL